MGPGGRRAAGGEEGGVEGGEEAREETKGNMVDWMCHSRPVGPTAPSRRLINQRLKWRLDDRQ